MSSQPPSDQRPLPHAGRPRGDAWRALVAEGIEWEGQILLGSDEHPLSARLIITSQRLAFAKGGEVVLDVARWWLKRPPYLSGNGAVNLRIETGSGHRDRLSFMTRDGRQAASDIVTLLTHGKQALPSAPLEPVYTEVPKRAATRRSYEPEPDLQAEPPASPARARGDEHTYSPDVIDATTLQVLGTTDFPPVTETQTPSTHRGSSTSGGRVSGEPITISTLGNQTHRGGEWSLTPIPALGPKAAKSSKAGWAFRLSGLIALIALAAAFGTQGLPDTSRLTNRGGTIIAPLTGDKTPTAGNVAQNLPTATEPSRSDPTRDAEQTAIAIGVGGETIEIATFTATATETASPTDTPEPTATETSEPEPTEDLTQPEQIKPTVDGSAANAGTEPPAPTETPTVEPTLPPTDTPTVETPPTETPTVEVQPTETPAPTDVPPTETPTLEPTIAPTEAPTTAPSADASATIEPTLTPTMEPTAGPSETPTLEPTATETTEPTATETPEPTPTAGFPFQERTIGDDEPAKQVFSTGAFRYTVEYAERGAEIPTLELPAVAGGDWVVIVLHAENWSTEPATLNMADFQLLVSGDFGYQFVGMDASSPDIGRFLGFDPVLEIAELRSIPAGEGMRLALVYLVPPTTTNIELIDDTSGLNIGPALALGGDITNLGVRPVRPDLLEVTVTEVLDGRTIVVQAPDGFTATIQYLGIVVPTGGQCFAAEATETNSNIVLGKTVYLEREYRNRVIADGDTLARDVWIDNQQGGLVLVAAWLASEGAAVPSPVEEDTRFAGWIQAAADAAEGNTVGFWAACGGQPVEPDTAQGSAAAQAVVPYDPFLTFSR